MTPVPDLFPAKHVIAANDRTLESYLCLASHLGIENLDWKYEWKDSGRVEFSFASVEVRNSFRNLRHFF